MASTDARPIPQKNTAYRIYFPIMDADGDLVTGAAGLDSEVSKDGGTFADCTNEATEIATSSGMYYLDLTSTEMNADAVAVIVKTSTSGAKTTTLVMYPEEAGDIRVNVTAFGGTAGTFASGRPEVNTTHAAGTAWGSGAITAASIASDAITAAKVASDVTTEIQSGLATASALSTVAGYIDTEVATIVTQTSAASIRSAVGLASANLDTQIATLATASSLSTVAGYVDTEVAAIKAVTDKLDDTLEDDGGTYRFTTNALEQAPSGSGASAASIADAVWEEALTDHSGTAGSVAEKLAAVATASALSTVSGYIDTEVAAIKAKTDNLPSDPADASDISSAFGTVNSTLSTIAGYLDTEVAAILADTNELQTDLANGGRLDLLIDAIKAKTDSLTFTVAGQVDANIQYVNDVLVTGNGQSGTEWGP